MNRRSLHFSILSFFIFTSLVTFVALGSYVVKTYRDELKTNLHNSLLVMGEDVIRHKLYKNMPAEKLKESFHLFESYHNSPFVMLFDHLAFAYLETVPELTNLLRVVKPLPDGRYLLISSRLDAVNEKSTQFALRLFMAFGTVLLLFIIIFHAMLSKLFMPLNCLVNFCNSSSEKKNDLPLCSGSYEVNNLKTAILNLMDKNQKMCKHSQDIFKEAAHEIKSPIAILKARLSLFRQNDNYDKEIFLDESFRDISTISTKLKELLFLKEIEWDMQQAKETISVQRQCEMMRASFEPILEKKGITMESSMEQDFNLDVHMAAMQKVMQAIFENIFIHTKNGSVIKNIVSPDKKQMHIINEMGSKSDETLFSSFIGSKVIDRLAAKLGYTYETFQEDGYFHTIITFDVADR